MTSLLIYVTHGKECCSLGVRPRSKPQNLREESKMTEIYMISTGVANMTPTQTMHIFTGKSLKITMHFCCLIPQIGNLMTPCIHGAQLVDSAPHGMEPHLYHHPNESGGRNKTSLHFAFLCQRPWDMFLTFRRYL